MSITPRRIGRHARITLAVTLALLTATIRPADGQDAPDPPAKEPVAKSAKGSSGFGLWSIAGMMDQACRNISKRYNLDAEQEKQTRALMARRLQALLAEHETELRSLLMDRFVSRPDGQSDAEVAKHWANRALPIYEAARKTINEGNAEWRKILSAEQKRIHDTDMKMLRATFEQYDGRFARWQKGDYDPKADRFAPQSTLANATSTTTKRAPTHRQTPPRTVGKQPFRRNSEDHWDVYVRQFIDTHNLDESQTSSAMAILDDCKERAANYRAAHADDLAQAEALMRKQIDPGVDRVERDAARKRLSEVHKPIRDLYSELRARLGAIPTEAQKQARAEAVKVKRKKYMETLRKRREGLKTEVNASQPVSPTPPQRKNDKP